MPVPTELAAIAADPLTVAPYLEWASLLDGRGDPRGALVRLQIAMETAGPADRLALFQGERALFTSHADALFGPLASAVRALLADEPRYGPRVTQSRSSVGRWFFRGFITALTNFGVPNMASDAGADRAGNVSFAQIPSVMRSPELRCCSAISVPWWPRRLPAGIRVVRLRQAAITERLLAEPSLRELEIACLVDGIPLVHDGLEAFRLPGDTATVDALRDARLPALKRLVLTDLGVDPAALAELVSVVQPLRDDVDVELLFAAPTDVQNITTLEALDALGPIAHRITALTLTGGHRGDLLDLPWDAALPRLVKLDAPGGLTAATLRSPAFRGVRELFVGRGTYGFRGDQVLTNLLESGVAPALRTLGLCADECTPDREMTSTVARLAEAPFIALEVLMLAGTMGTPEKDLFAGLPEGAFPALRAAAIPGMWGRATQAGVRGQALEIDTTDHPLTFSSMKSMEGPPAAPPQFDGLQRGSPALDLSGFPRYAEIWRGGVSIEEATEEALVAKGRKAPRALEACEPFLAALGVTIETKGMSKLDRPAREERIGSWRSDIAAALRAKDGDVASRVFGLAGLAWQARRELFGGSEVRRQPVHARRFLEDSADLGEPARSELAELRSWCRRIAAGRPSKRVGRTSFTHGEYEERVLPSPFSEWAPGADNHRSAEAPAFETVSVDDVRRNALWHGVRAIVAGKGDWSFEGDAERGALFWQSGAGNDSLIAWCPDGVVGFAHDLYTYDDVEEESALAMLGEAPEALRELVTPLLARWVDRPTSALWITRDARHRVPTELIHGCTRGIELLDAYIADVPTDMLIDDLVERVLAGGGEIPAELLDLEGAGGELGVDAVLERLGALGLRRA